ncbi:MAG TPA: alpha/beta hydrolase [Candidatus Acidoferrum sp.]|nr:alpha/beta hydrolase [Candidatus Acidoferrum sp.]
MLRRILLLLPLLLTYSARAAAPAVKDGFFKTSDGVRLHYQEAGSGPAIFFEPGWSMPSWIWDSQIRHFAEHYHVIALDPRSQGDSEKTLEGNSCERRARDIKELLEHLKLGPVVLVGWSLGVPELLTYAEQFGGSHVRAYVFVDGFAWEKQDPQFITSMVGTYTQVQTNRREFTEKFVRSMYSKPQPEEYIQRVIAASLKMPTDSAVAASVSSISRASWHSALAKLDRPVLVMFQAALKSMAAEMLVSVVPPARVELFEDAGHALFVDDAERFNTVLEDFIHHLPE